MNAGKTPEGYMRQTLTLAAEALQLGEFPIAAIVVLDDRAIARATASEQRERRFLGHAELVALEEADRLRLSLDDRRNARLFTNLEPCLMCMGAAMSFFLGEVYYSETTPLPYSPHSGCDRQMCQAQPCSKTTARRGKT
jgi:tRNA(adenine34) deaminase